MIYSLHMDICTHYSAVYDIKITIDKCSEQKYTMNLNFKWILIDTNARLEYYSANIDPYRVSNIGFVYNKADD